MIKAVFYDMGDIFFEAHFWRQWLYGEAKKNAGYAGVFSDFYCLWEDCLKATYEGRHSYDQAFFDLMNRLKLKGQDDFRSRAYVKKKYFEDNRELFEGVAETLRLLVKFGVNNIVITDNEQSGEDIRANILKRYGVDEYIFSAISSREYGLTKDTPELFKHVLKKFSLTCEECFFVGHDAEEIDSARLAGIGTILFNNYLSIDIKSDYTISQFEQIQDIILA